MTYIIEDINDKTFTLNTIGEIYGTPSNKKGEIEIDLLQPMISILGNELMFTEYLNNRLFKVVTTKV